MSDRLAAIVLAAFTALACSPPVAAPLAGAPVPAAAMPRAGLPPGYRHIVFTWEYVEGNSLTRGDGSVRIAPPDSARLDLFLGGFGGGAAVLIGDSLRAPLPRGARGLIPPPPMVWAAFGRLAVAPAPDTVVRSEGGLVRADIGRGTVWRATFRDGRLVRLEQIASGKVLAHVTRDGNVVRYENNAAPRRLTLTITSDEPVTQLDPSIWLN